MPINDFSSRPLTWRPDPRGLTRPKYLALASRLERDIESGLLSPGLKLPPQRELADWLDLNFTTVTRAYDVCRERGLVYGVVGRGTFVAPLPGERGEDGSRVLNLGEVQGFPDLGAGYIVDAAREVLARDYTLRLFSYENRDGTARHRAAGAYWLSRFGAPAKASQVAVFPGVQNALVTILLAFFHAGDSLAVDAFTYANLIGAARLTHVRLVPVEGDDEGMLPGALDELAARTTLRGVFLMPVCSNPETLTMGAERKAELANVMRRRNLIVIEDDAALLPRSTETFFSLLPERTFYLTGNTRFVSAGLRVAFAASPVAMRDKLLAALHQLTIKTGAFDAEIMSELILGGRASEILLKKIERAREMNRVFGKVFPGERRRSDDVPFFRTVALPGIRKNGPEIEQELLAKGVRVCHSCRFSVLPNPGRSFLRLSLSSVSGRAELAEALDLVKGWMDNRQK